MKGIEKQEEMWEKQHELAAEKIYSMCYELGGFFLKVLGFSILELGFCYFMLIIELGWKELQFWVMGFLVCIFFFLIWQMGFCYCPFWFENCDHDVGKIAILDFFPPLIYAFSSYFFIHHSL